MVNMLVVGLAGVQALCAHSQLPVHGHRAGWGMLSRHPLLGMDYPACASFFRLAGVDHLHVNGLRNKFCEPDASVVRSARACLEPLGSSSPVLPVFSSGQWARASAGHLRGSRQRRPSLSGRWRRHGASGGDRGGRCES